MDIKNKKTEDFMYDSSDAEWSEDSTSDYWKRVEKDVFRMLDEDEQKELKQKMSIEEYKKKIEECLEANYNVSTKPSPLMKEYEDDFQEFLELDLSVETVAAGMVLHLL